MFRLLPSLSIAALMAMTLPVLAQQTTTTDEAPTDAAPADTADTADTADSQLDLGQPIPTVPQLGERYAKEEFGDWTLACIRTENQEEDPCSLLQILKDESGNPVAEVSLFRIEGGGQAVAGATVIVPLETLLPAQLAITVDGAAGKRYNYTLCNPIGCVAQIGLTAEDVAAFKRGKVATVSLVPAPAPDEVIGLPMSLTGFTAGYNAVDVVKN